MTQGVYELIDAIAAGDSLAIEQSFNAEMANRISTRLEDMRVDVAQNMFRTESVESEEVAEEVAEETELTFEDYSLEELQDYMMSEEFEQLDELSKDTLKSYLGKAKTELGIHARNVGNPGATAKGQDVANKSATKRTAGATLAGKKLKN